MSTWFRGVLERETGSFAIDLKNVVLVDRDALKLLALSEANGTEIRNCTPNIREWITRGNADEHHASDCGTVARHTGAHRQGNALETSRWYAFRRSSKRCPTCEYLRRLLVRSQAALRNVRSLNRAAVKSTDSAALQNLEEELKQTSAARQLICIAIQAYLINQHSQTPGLRLAA